MDFRIPAILLSIAVLCVFFSLPSSGDQGGERILSFHSDITIHEDASMTVQETIRVRSQGNKIKRGIYRDFPTRYRGRGGKRYVVGFEVDRVSRDGRPESYHTERISNGVRVYMGREGVFLKPGEHTYVLTYRTDRQLGFFEDHDELYWNVTGLGWAFPIDEALATVRLPPSGLEEHMTLEAYTGPEGSKGGAYKAEMVEAGVASFVTTRRLNPNEGLTIVVGFPKGIVQEPSVSEEFSYALRDNLADVTALVGIVVLLIYYVLVWSSVGIDPAKGRIVPRATLPSGFSPAAARFVWKMGFDHKTFAVALINMAIKGYIRIEERNGTYFIVRDRASKSVLSREEAKIAAKLLGGGRTEFKFDQKHHAKISAAIDTCKRELKRTHERTYFITNSKYLAPGIVISVLTVLIAAGLHTLDKGEPLALFMCVWLSGWTAGVAFLLSMVARAWQGVLAGNVRSAGQAGCLTLFAIPFVLGELVGIGALFAGSSALMMVSLFAFFAINLLFYQLLKAPTLLGRRTMDEMEGLRMWLRGEERFGPREESGRASAVFEQYLPYAIALGQEEEWSKRFTNALERAGMRSRRYSPPWYRGRRWPKAGMAGAGVAGFASRLSSSFSSAISSSSMSPGSSSGGGGGGFSGGGGGGGGGGGW